MPTPAQDRAYVARQIASGRLVAGARANDPSQWSDAYARRIANYARAHRGAVSLQAARRGGTATARAREFLAAEQRKGRRTAPGGVGLEHPRSRWVGPVKRDARGRMVPDLDTGAGFYAKQYKSPAAAQRYAARLSAERIQVLAYGTLARGYGGDAGQAWRVLYTGPRDGAPWGAIRSGYATHDGSVRTPAFDHIARIEVRYGSYIG